MRDAATAAAGELAYRAIRGGVGINDLSDLTKLRIRGEGATALLDELVAGNVERLVENSIRWTALLDERGRVAADLQIYADFGEYFVTCASGTGAALLAALRAAGRADVEIEDQTHALAAIAVEGPDALDVPTAVAGPDAAGLSLLKFTRCTVGDGEALLGRIGFTGEFGYVFFVPRERAGDVVARIRAAAPQAVACDPAVQDVLRLEMRSFNLARDVVDDESALEAGLHWMIDFRKPAFRGREAVMAEKAAGLRRRLVGFVADGPGTVGRGTVLSDAGQRVGYVANAAWSPALEQTIGLAYLDDAYAWVGLELAADGAGGAARVTTKSAPFFLTESTKRTAR